MKFEEQENIMRNAMDQAAEAWKQVRRAEIAATQPDRVFFRDSLPEQVQLAKQAASLAQWWAEGVRCAHERLHKEKSLFEPLASNTKSSAWYAAKQAERLAEKAEERWMAALT